MRYLQAGFVGEGPTDAQFLAPLARRLLEQHLLLHSRSDVLIPDPVVLRPGGSWGNKPDAVVREMADEFSHLDVLLYHTDAAGDVARAYRERVRAVSSRTGVPVIGVVPKREMEAWALADAAALCGVLGVDGSRLDVPAPFTPRLVESITDPKAELDAFTASVTTRHYNSSDPELTLFGALALTVDLDVLVAVPQARRLADDIAALAHDLGWLR